MFYGKILAGMLGFALAGPFGLVLGIMVGHWFDRGLRHSLAFGSPEQLARVQQAFFETSFLLLGHLAKADGRVSEEEIAHTEEIIRHLGSNDSQRQEAIALFKRGAESDFLLEATVAEFNQVCQGHRQVKQALLAFLVSLAAADGHLHPAELQVLETVATLLGYSRAEFERMVRMVQAQSHFHQGGQQARPAGDQVAEAYLALGVAPTCSDRELKQAYRRLMSENHPDKLIAQGVPEHMIKLATERSQDIQAAYELLKKQRKGA